MPYTHPMRVAVVTPYFRETDETLARCRESVAAQTFQCTHIFVADGFPNQALAKRISEHIVLPHPHADVGNLARCAGALSAASSGFDAVAFLDADNWYQPDHIASLVELQISTSAAVCTSGRSIHRLDGSLLLPLDPESNGDHFADTSTHFYHRTAFHILPVWGLMARELAPIGDRIVWGAVLARKLPKAHSGRPTLAFRTQYSAHYAKAGEPPPPDAKAPQENGPAIAFWNAMPADERRRLIFGA